MVIGFTAAVAEDVEDEETDNTAEEDTGRLWSADGSWGETDLGGTAWRGGNLRPVEGEGTLLLSSLASSLGSACTFSSRCNVCLKSFTVCSCFFRVWVRKGEKEQWLRSPCKASTFNMFVAYGELSRIPARPP